MLVCLLCLGVPVHVARMSQLSLDCELPGRGGLKLSVVEQRIYLLCGGAMLPQTLMLLDKFDVESWGGCRLFSFYALFISLMGTNSGTAVALCRQGLKILPKEI